MVTAGQPVVRIENLGIEAQLQNVLRQIALLDYENDLLNILIDGKGVLPSSLPSAPLHNF